MNNVVTKVYVTEIMQACALAGKPQLAAQFIEKKMSHSVVVNALLNARADEDEALCINGTAPSPKRSWHKSFDDPEEVQEIFDRRTERVREVAQQAKAAR